MNKMNIQFLQKKMCLRGLIGIKSTGGISPVADDLKITGVSGFLQPGKRRLSLLILIYICYFLISAFYYTTQSSYAAEKSVVPSYGSGPVELIAFTDYSSESCQDIENDLEQIYEKLLKLGEVKITFVDLPGKNNTGSNPSGPLFTKYFLYAAGAETDYANTIQARKFIFRMAKHRSITEQAIEKTFKIQGIAFRIYNYKPVLNEWKAIATKYNCSTTPTYILKLTRKDVRRYTQPDQIRKLLIPELQKLAEKEKTFHAAPQIKDKKNKK